MKHPFRKVPTDSYLILGFVVLKLAIHLYTNTFAGYGVFRDELYLYACSIRPDIGYVDQPPLSVWILGLSTFLFGKSIFALRLLPALFGSLALLPIIGIVRELGGKSRAIVIASMAYIISPIYLAYSGYYSMNSIDLLLWSSAFYLLLRVSNSQNPNYWVLLGVVMGLGLLNKIGMLWFGFGLLVALMLTRERKWLTTKWPYFAGMIAFVIFSPYIIWNALHQWPTVEFMGSTGAKYSTQNQLTFLSGQLLINNPTNIVIWVSGIIYFLFLDKERKGLPIFLIFLTVLSILLVNGASKPEYLAQAFMVLLIGGAMAIERWSMKRTWIFYLVLLHQISGFVAAPLAIPILPVEKYVDYSKTIGIAPSTAEGHELAELPQFYADMFGWEGQAKAIATAYHSLSDEDKAKCAIFGDNYGRSGAVDFYAEEYDLPRSIGRHNNYWIWGPGEYTGELMLILSNDVGDKAELFDEVADLGTVYTKYAIPYENNLHLYLCRNMQVPLEELWPQLKNYN